MPRVELLLKHGESRAFTPFDRFAQFEESKGKSLSQLIDTFAGLRRANLERLMSLELTPNDLRRRGLHPELGPVNLGELLATWVVHDLNHIGQIARVMSRQYQGSVGPWVEYLPILTRGPGRTSAQAQLGCPPPHPPPVSHYTYSQGASLAP